MQVPLVAGLSARHASAVGTHPQPALKPGDPGVDLACLEVTLNGRRSGRSKALEQGRRQVTGCRDVRLQKDQRLAVGRCARGIQGRGAVGERPRQQAQPPGSRPGQCLEAGPIGAGHLSVDGDDHLEAVRGQILRQGRADTRQQMPLGLVVRNNQARIHRDGHDDVTSVIMRR